MVIADMPKKRMEQLYNNIESWISKRLTSEKETTTYKNKNHLSILFSEKSKKNISPLVIGYNHYNIGEEESVHAEMDILNKALKAPNIGRNKYSLVVIRTNTYNSRPCYHCIKRISETYKIRIKYVYYTLDKGFVRESTRNLIDSSDTAIITRYYRENG
jgi:cytidine deaminase